jgi:hypothetical protein
MIWDMDRYIDMQYLKRKYGDSWASLNKNLAKTPFETFRLATTHLLFEIIRDLISRDEIQTADSILNSTSNPRWQAENFHQGIETVKKLPPGLNIENRQGMFSLDHSDDGRFHQCWIIDRVMGKGGFWVGKVANTMKLPEENASSAITQTDTPAETGSKNEAKFSSAGHQSMLFTRWMLSNLLSMANSTMDKPEDKEDTEPRSFLLQQGDLLASICFAINATASPEKHIKEILERRAIFDIDGDATGACLVFQPYHMMLESIPRPALRNMSVSWKVTRIKEPAVESMENSTDADEGGNKEQIFTTHGAVKGMWRYSTILGNRVLLV